MDPDSVHADHQSAEMGSSLISIRILVVDDDSTALFIVTEVLKKWNYEVTGVKNPIDAITILRMRRGSFDLIVTDYHMPIMNGIQLQQRIHEEFDLPVIMMSGDNSDYVMLKSLECGAAYFILKPVKPIDCKNLWQYAVARSGKGKSVIVPEHIPPAPIAPPPEDLSYLQDPLHENRNGAKPRGRSRNRTRDPNGFKKPKIAWTNFLHNRFLQAVNFIGMDKAVPKKILELMNVPGLTRQNIASHLQKYRIFLKRVEEKGRGYSLHGSGNALIPNPSFLFTLPHPPSMMRPMIPGEYPNFLANQSRAVLPFQLGQQWNPSPVFNNCSMIGANQFPASSSQGGFDKQMVVGTASNDLHISGIPSFRMDLLNSNARDFSMYSAMNEFTSFPASKQVGPNHSFQASSSVLTPSLLDPDFGKNDFSLGNYSGGHGNTPFLRNGYPSGLSLSNIHSIDNSGQMMTGNEALLIGTNPEGWSGAGLNMTPTVYTPKLSDDSYKPDLGSGDILDMLLDQLSNTPPTQGGEELLQITDGSQDREDQTPDFSENYAVDDTALWDYEELLGQDQLQPVTAEQEPVYRPEQVPSSAENAPRDMDWDNDFIESLFASAAPSPAMD